MGSCNEEVGSGMSRFSAAPGAYKKWGKGGVRPKSEKQRDITGIFEKISGFLIFRGTFHPIV